MNDSKEENCAREAKAPESRNWIQEAVDYKRDTSSFWPYNKAGSLEVWKPTSGQDF